MELGVGKTKQTVLDLKKKSMTNCYNTEKNKIISLFILQLNYNLSEHIV